MESKQLKRETKVKAKPKAKAKAKAKPKKEKKPYYVNSKEFSQALEDFYMSGSDDISEQLGIYIHKIATGLSYAPNFINYTYKEDMIGDAVYKMLLAIKNKKFKLDSGNNPFSYFTTVAFHAFINRIKKEKKQREIVSEYQESVYDELATNSDLSVHLNVGNTTKTEDL
mgnify:CR=1 FL=1